MKNTDIQAALANVSSIVKGTVDTASILETMKSLTNLAPYLPKLIFTAHRSDLRDKLVEQVTKECLSASSPEDVKQGKNILIEQGLFHEKYRHQVWQIEKRLCSFP